MNIVFFIRSLHPGGAERQLCLLATELAKRGHAVTIIVLYSGGAYEDLLKNTRVRLKSVDKKSRWDLMCLIRLVKLVYQLKPDVIHSYLTAQNVLLGFLKSLLPRRAKIVFGVRVSNMPLDRYGWLDTFLSQLEAVYSYSAHLTIVNAKQGYEHAIKSCFRKKNLIIIQNGIETDKFIVSNIPKNISKAALSIELDKYYLVGCVARIDPVKDQETFFKAAEKLLRCRQDVRFMLVGGISDAAYHTKLKALITSLKLEPYITWLPAQIDMQGVYSALDVLCLTSVSEGFPNVIAEAMACGVPCVVTDVGDAKEMVGGLGWIVPTQEPDAVATALERMLSISHDAKLIRQRIIDNYSVKTMVDKTEEQLRQWSPR